MHEAVGHLDADEQRVAEQRAIAVGERVVQRLQHVERRLVVELEDQVALAAGHHHRRSDRPAALRDDRIDREIAGERHPDHAGAERLAVGEQPVSPRHAAAADQPAELRRARERIVEPVDQPLRVAAERVHEHQQPGREELHSLQFGHGNSPLTARYYGVLELS